MLLAIERLRNRSAMGLLPVVALGAVALYSVGLVHLMTVTSYRHWGAAVVGPVLLLGSIPLLRRAARDEEDGFFWFLFLALACKLTASLIRYVFNNEVYGGVADAGVYANEGERLAEAYRQGNFGAPLGRDIPGTGGARLITGLLFALIGRTDLGGYLVFSWWAFLGLLAAYKAFRIGLPLGDHRRYALLLFFLPSLLYWPSSIGKDAWMLLGLGVAALGAARLLMRKPRAYLMLGLGLGATTLIRPHISVLVAAGLVAAYVLRPRPERPPLFGPLGKPVGIAALLVVSAIFAMQAGEFFGVEDEGAQGVTQVLDKTAEQTSQGGSSFEAVNARSVTDVPAAVLAVLFRPFPWEAGNAQALIASAEGMAMLALLTLSVRRFKALPIMARKNPYVVLALVYTLLFCIAFSSFGNFGILARQRVQLFPFALVLLCLPRARAIPRRLQLRH
jgi:hypothetical protein